MDIFEGLKPLIEEHSGLVWPKASLFPLNLSSELNVEEIVATDLKQALDVLIVTGYAALDRIANLAPSCKDEATIRLLFGTEPYPIKRGRYNLPVHTLPKEIEAYWLEQGISLYHSASILQCVELIESGRVKARFLGKRQQRLHAKIYCTESAATVGSSNFTRPGMEYQIEANARFLAMPRAKAKRYDDLRQIAENFWAIGQDFTERLLELLKQLMKEVTWQEALARACAELLEGEWAERFVTERYFSDDPQLWPSQRQGIAQALYVLTHHGSVLIADATGSGKTRMGANLIGAVSDHNLRMGRRRRGSTLLICPPLVIPTWKSEAGFAKVALDARSHGALSASNTNSKEELVLALRRTDQLCVDEGHNFLNLKSTRTQKLLRNIADSVIVFTATPINRSIVDLLRIADILGADNLAPSALKMFNKLIRSTRMRRAMSVEETEAFRKEIRHFTVRRTKKVLNELIRREPEKYTDKFGKRCRFPKHKVNTYSLDEPAEDRKIAEEIRQLAETLKAVTHFQKPLRMPPAFVERGISAEEYLKGRLLSATKMAKYMVTKSLRSSTAALVEHLQGSVAACERFGIDTSHKKATTGNMLAKLENIAGRPPRNFLATELPDWLESVEAHRQACVEDAATYRKILNLALRLSSSREEAKARLLVKLAETNPAVLAFDSHPISLAVIQKLIRTLSSKQEVVVGTGESITGRKAILASFALGSAETPIIGLCSDSLAEGVNLQRASALVHLDRPSVVRVAEQRVGRVDRLDSPHSEVAVWWPEDATEFALSTDEKFIARHNIVEALLGTNLPIPETFRRLSSAPLAAREAIEELEKEVAKEDSEGSRDAFDPVRALVQGPTSLVDADIYERYRKVDAHIVSRVSIVKSSTNWAFFCLRGGEYGAPRWLLLPSVGADPIIDLEEIAKELRARLLPETKNLKMDSNAEKCMAKFLDQLSRAERTLLSPRKQQALKELEKVLELMIDSLTAAKDRDAVRQLTAVYRAISAAAHDGQPDWDEVAVRWLDIVRPIWYDCLSRPRTKPLLLKDIRDEILTRQEVLLPKIISAFESLPIVQPPDERVAVAVVGMNES